METPSMAANLKYRLTPTGVPVLPPGASVGFFVPSLLGRVAGPGKPAYGATELFRTPARPHRRPSKVGGAVESYSPFVFTPHSACSFSLPRRAASVAFTGSQRGGDFHSPVLSGCMT